ncbi:MAG: cyclic 2,3-diphosphoglycerate synthase [Candidatus Asgardarchaeia archaeon]
MKRRKVIILGAAGRDFHNFNVFFRNNKNFEVVAFTATQIPNIEGREYPPDLSGELYPDGIPIYPEEELPELIKKFGVDVVVFAYSDVSHEYVMHKASIALANGADFWLMGPSSTTLKSKKAVIAVCAVRTGCGKSQTSRRICDILHEYGIKYVVVRHPMPYGDLSKQAVQRFSSYDDLDKYQCTIEEREEYEPHIRRGNVVYAGVDYEAILREAEKEGDVILWDGGNNDFPFYKPDLHIVVVDAHRPGHEVHYHPGEANFRMADVIVINKVDTADRESVEMIKRNIRELNPKAIVIEAASPIAVDDPSKISGKRVLVVEDGPTLTHGGMRYGAGYIAAKKYGASEIVDPRPFAVGSIKETYERYKHLDLILPAMGYGKRQIEELEETINNSDADTVVIGTPVDLRKIININKDAVRVTYELKELTKPNLEDVIREFLKKIKGDPSHIS